MDNRWFTCLSLIYRWLLGLYPADFLAEFGEEMQNVFAQAAWEAGKSGAAVQAAVLLREIRGVCASAVRLRTRRRVVKMMEEKEKDRSTGLPALPAPWRQVAAGLLPFVLLGTVEVISALPGSPRQYQQYYALAFMTGMFSYPVILVYMLWGWLKDFPRWVYASLIYGVIFALMLSNSATPGFMISPLTWDGSRWGWRAFIPLTVVVILGLVIRPSLEPFFKMLEDIWNDWSRLAFSLYGLVPLLIPIGTDEIEMSYKFPTTIVAVILMWTGAFIYLRFQHRWFHAWGLILGTFLVALSLGIGSELYWQTHYVNFSVTVRILLPGPIPWESILTKSAALAGIVTLIILLTGLVGLAHRIVNRTNTRANGPAA